MNLSENPLSDLTKKRKLEQDDVVSPPSTTLSHDDIYKIIRPFTHEQLSQIVTAALRHSDILNSVRSIADLDFSQRSLYIRGLDAETTSENLRDFFATYGELIEAFAVTDKATGKGKGYGFLTFKHIDGAIRALKEPNKRIGGKMTVTHLACHNNNGISKSNESVDNTFRKVYVGNVLADMSGERLLDHFASYGEVEEGPIGADKTTGKFRGFAFFIYKNEEGARACLLDPNKNIEGHQLHCRLAITRKAKALIAAKAPTPSAAAPLAPSAALLAPATAPSVPAVAPSAPAAAPSAPAAAPSAPAAALSAPDAAPPAPAAAPWGLSPHSVNFNPGSVSGQFSYGINASGVDAPLAATSAQLRGSDDGVKPEVVNSNHHSSMDGSFVSQFGGREPSGVSVYAGNMGGSGLPGGQCGAFGDGGGRQGLPLGHSQDPLNSNLGSRTGLSSFGGIAGGSRLLTNGSYTPTSLGGGSGLFSNGYGGSLFGGLGASRG